MTNSLMAKMNLKGKKGKYVFGNTNICKIIKGMISLNEAQTKQKIMKYCFYQIVFTTKQLYIKWSIIKNYVNILDRVIQSYPKATEANIFNEMSRFLKYAP